MSTYQHRLILVRYCDLCGSRVRISLEALRRLQAEHRKLMCGRCIARRRIGWYDDQVIHND